MPAAVFFTSSLAKNTSSLPLRINLFSTLNADRLMSDPETPLPSKFPTFAVNHIGIVTRDVERCAKKYEALFGFGPFNVMLRDLQKIELHGQPAEVRHKTAVGFGAGIQFHISQVVEGRSAHSEFLAAGKEGLHHLGIFVDDFDGELANYTSKGYAVLSRGFETSLRVRWAYIDTAADLGFYMEIIEKPPLRRKKAKQRS